MFTIFEFIKSGDCKGDKGGLLSAAASAEYVAARAAQDRGSGNERERQGRDSSLNAA